MASPRVSRVITRTGDRGEAALADGKRMPKGHPRFALIGDLDEANSFIGLLAARVGEAHRERLVGIQSRLFDVGGAVAVGAAGAGWPEQTGILQDWTRAMNATLPPLKEFVLPGGDGTVALAHVARSVTRRAERAFWAEAEALAPLVEAGVGAWLNRLSDYLFVLARTLAREGGVAEVLWQPLAPPEDA